MNINLWVGFLSKSFTKLLLILLPVTALILSGCGGERSEAKTGSLSKSTPAQITNVSKDNYDDNVNGLITYKTLKGWLDNWQQNKPAGINGKLVIIQQQIGDTGFEFIKPNNETSFTYVQGSWLETRSEEHTSELQSRPHLVCR